MKKNGYLLFLFILLLFFFLINGGCKKNNNNGSELAVDIFNQDIEENKIPEMYLSKFSTSVYNYKNTKIEKNILISGERAIKYLKRNGIIIKNGEIKYFNNNKVVQIIRGDEAVIDDLNNINKVTFTGNSEVFDIQNNFFIQAETIILDIKNNVFKAYKNIYFEREVDNENSIDKNLAEKNVNNTNSQNNTNNTGKENDTDYQNNINNQNNNIKEISGRCEELFYYQNQDKIILNNNAEIHYYSNYATGKSITILNFNNSSQKNNNLQENNSNTKFVLVVKEGKIKYNKDKDTLNSNGIFIEFRNEQNNKSLKVYNGNVEYITLDNFYKITHFSNGQYLFYQLNEDKLIYEYINADNKIIKSKVNVSLNSSFSYDKNLKNDLFSVFFKSENGKLISENLDHLQSISLILNRSAKLTYKELNKSFSSEGRMIIFEDHKKSSEYKKLKVYGGEVEYESKDKKSKITHSSSGEYMYYKFISNNEIVYNFTNAENSIIQTTLESSSDKNNLNNEDYNIYFKSKTGNLISKNFVVEENSNDRNKEKLNVENKAKKIDLILKNDAELIYKNNKTDLNTNGDVIYFNEDNKTKSLKVFEGKVEYNSEDKKYKTEHYSNGQYIYYLIKENNISNKENDKMNDKIIDNYQNNDVDLTYIYKNSENIIKRVDLKTNLIKDNIYFKSEEGKIENNKDVNLKGQSIIIDYKNRTFVYGEKLNYDNNVKIAQGDKNLVIFQFMKDNIKKVDINSKNSDIKSRNLNSSMKKNEHNNLVMQKQMDKFKKFNYSKFESNKNDYIKKNYDYNIIDKIISGEKGTINTETKKTTLENNVIINDFQNLFFLKCKKLSYSGEKSDYYVLTGSIETKKYENTDDLINNKNLSLYLIGGKAKIYNKEKYGLITDKPKLLNIKENYFISSDIIEAYFEEDKYLFKNNVLFLYNSVDENNKKIKTIAKGSFAQFDNKTSMFELKGNGYVSINGSESKSTNILIDINKKKIYLKEVINVKILEF